MTGGVTAKKLDPSGDDDAAAPSRPNRSGSAATASCCPCWARSASISQTGFLARTAASRANSRATVEAPSPGVGAGELDHPSTMSGGRSQRGPEARHF